jgi:hypothetical protein
MCPCYSPVPAAALHSVTAADALLVSKKKSFSSVWLYFGFKLYDKEQLASICRLCGKEVQAKSKNISNLFSNMKNRHPVEYLETKAKGESRKAKAGSQSQATIAKSFENGQPLHRSSKKWQSLTESVSYTIAKDMLPFTAVEKPGFQKILSTFEPRYQLPGKKYFSKTGTPHLYNTVKSIVEAELASDKEFFSQQRIYG